MIALHDQIWTFETTKPVHSIGRGILRTKIMASTNLDPIYDCCVPKLYVFIFLSFRIFDGFIMSDTETENVRTSEWFNGRNKAVIQAIMIKRMMQCVFFIDSNLCFGFKCGTFQSKLNRKKWTQSTLILSHLFWTGNTFEKINVQSVIVHSSYLIVVQTVQTLNYIDDSSQSSKLT